MSEQTEMATVEPAEERPLPSHREPSERESAAVLGPDTPAKGDSVYTVQVRDSLAADGDELWRDLATVTIKAGSPRRLAIREALTVAALKPDPKTSPLRVRVLDKESAAETEVPAVQPDPEWIV